MRVLVTGGAGFLGRYVIDRLTKGGYDVISVDVNSSGEKTRLLDITNPQAVNAIFSSTMPDIVIHLAARTGSSGKGGGRESIHDPYGYFRTNVMGTLTVLEACRLHSIRRLIHMSSLSPHGITKGPIDETTPFNPTNPYGFSKECAELAVKCYANNYGIKTLIFRAPLLAGEKQVEENALQEFVRSVKRGHPIIIRGDGSHVREWLHPIDVVEAFLKGITYLDSMTSSYEVFVLGNRPIAMKELARVIIGKVGGKICYQDDNCAFDQYTDTNKVETILRWKPKVQVQEIVERVIADIFVDDPKAGRS